MDFVIWIVYFRVGGISPLLVFHSPKDMMFNAFYMTINWWVWKKFYWWYFGLFYALQVWSLDSHERAHSGLIMSKKQGFLELV